MGAQVSLKSKSGLILSCHAPQQKKRVSFPAAFPKVWGFIWYSSAKGFRILKSWRNSTCIYCTYYISNSVFVNSMMKTKDSKSLIELDNNISS